MDISIKVLCSLLFVEALLVPSPQMAAGEKCTDVHCTNDFHGQTRAVYREYIGAMGKGVNFTDVPIYKDVDFHFILAFAADYKIDTDKTPYPSYGNFSAFWDTENLTTTSVWDIKKKYTNVKVAVSLGGAKVGNTPVLFTADSVDNWVINATASLSDLIEKYHLDGIDIDYENFSKSVSTETFAECIGRLIKNLKSKRVIKFVSIAPFEDNDGIPSPKQYYDELWKKHHCCIDYVNFQFYAYSSHTSKEDFRNHYDEQHSKYGGKLLAGFTTDYEDKNLGLLPEKGFFEACKDLQTKGKLSGIFGWCADTSKKKNFKDECDAQSLLTKGKIDQSIPHQCKDT